MLRLYHQLVRPYMVIRSSNETSKMASCQTAHVPGRRNLGPSHQADHVMNGEWTSLSMTLRYQNQANRSINTIIGRWHECQSAGHRTNTDRLEMQSLSKVTVVDAKDMTRI